VTYNLSKASKWTTVAFPKEIVETVRKLIEAMKYWPSVTSFCREVVLEKIKEEKIVLKEIRENKERTDVDEEK